MIINYLFIIIDKLVIITVPVVAVDVTIHHQCLDLDETDSTMLVMHPLGCLKRLRRHKALVMCAIQAPKRCEIERSSFYYSPISQMEQY